jgi:CheY-like chemotaxis protein
VRYRAEPDLRPLLGNPTQLQQVLMNLCVNARDAMPAGGAILLAAENFTVDESYASGHPDAVPGEYVLLGVSDTGSGIPEEIRGKIFEPFFSTKEPGKGTGLGLSTAAGIVRNHGGFMEVKSAPGQGTTFLIYLPATGENRPNPDRQRTTEAPRGNGELILVVDDESSVLKATAATLVRHGYRALTACDGAEAVMAYARDGAKIRAVLTDVHMPIVDGPTLTRTLKNIVPDIRVIFMTGSVDESRMGEFDSLEISGVLAKPYHSEKLLNLLHETLLPAKAPCAR